MLVSGIANPNSDVGDASETSFVIEGVPESITGDVDENVSEHQFKKYFFFMYMN